MLNWKYSASTLAIAALASPIFAAAAQAQLVGATRCAKQSTAIFSQRSSTSAVVRAIGENQSVTISENASQNGFIGVSAPAAGFIQTVNLKLCPNPGGNPGSGTCRRVKQQQGLIVRQGPNVSSAFVGEVADNTRVFLTTNPATTRTDSSGRIWVQIAQPVSGWVSNGFQNTPGTNLVYCQ